MNDARYLTAKESLLLSRTAERLLRLADVEFNLGEHVLTLLKQATLRQADCRARRHREHRLDGSNPDGGL